MQLLPFGGRPGNSTEGYVWTPIHVLSLVLCLQFFIVTVTSINTYSYVHGLLLNNQ